MRFPAKTQGVFRFRTPGKITPFIRILRRRIDGFHEVRLTLFPVSIYDTLTWEPGPEPLSLRVESPEPLGPDDKNLVVRAVSAFQTATGLRIGGAWRLSKHIPVGAGLGGGSGNAAGVLVVLNRLHGSPLSESHLHDLAATLGSDVPFFLAARPQWASGRGEHLLPLGAPPPLSILVVKPAFSISTAEAYRLVTPRDGDPAPPLLSTLDDVIACLGNDFEPALAKAYPELAQVKKSLLDAGARGALLSGSGSAVFGVFSAEGHRDAAQARLSAAHPGWRTMACATLPQHEYDIESP